MGEAQWIVVISKPMNEELAEKSIREAGYHTYLPRYRKILRGVRIDETGRRVRSRHGQVVFRPLFPRYLFAELYPDQQWRAILSASGVMDFIWRGERPAALKSAIIESVRDMEQRGEFDEARPTEKRRDIKPGNVVRVEAGPYQGFLATIKDVDEAGRVRALVAMFGRESLATFQPSVPLAVVNG